MINRFIALSIVYTLAGSIGGLATFQAATIAKPIKQQPVKLPGNVTQGKLNQLWIGMTEKQVITALGTPRAKYRGILFYNLGEATVEIYFKGGKYSRHEVMRAG